MAVVIGQLNAKVYMRWGDKRKSEDDFQIGLLEATNVLIMYLRDNDRESNVL